MHVSSGPMPLLEISKSMVRRPSSVSYGSTWLPTGNSNEIMICSALLLSQDTTIWLAEGKQLLLPNYVTVTNHQNNVLTTRIHFIISYTHGTFFIGKEFGREEKYYVGTIIDTSTTFFIELQAKKKMKKKKKVPIMEQVLVAFLSFSEAIQ